MEGLSRVVAAMPAAAGGAAAAAALDLTQPFLQRLERLLAGAHRHERASQASQRRQMGVWKVAWSVCLPRRPQDAAALIPAAVPAQVLLPELASYNAAAKGMFALDYIACCRGRAHAAYTRLLLAAVLCVVKQLAALRHATIALDAYRAGGPP